MIARLAIAGVLLAALLTGCDGPARPPAGTRTRGGGGIDTTPEVEAGECTGCGKVVAEGVTKCPDCVAKAKK